MGCRFIYVKGDVLNLMSITTDGLVVTFYTHRLVLHIVCIMFAFQKEENVFRVCPLPRAWVVVLLRMVVCWVLMCHKWCIETHGDLLIVLIFIWSLIMSLSLRSHPSINIVYLRFRTRTLYLITWIYTWCHQGVLHHVGQSCRSTRLHVQVANDAHLTIIAHKRLNYEHK